MKQKAAHYNGVQYGLSVWEGFAPDIGRKMDDMPRPFSVSAREHDDAFAEFETVDVWTHDGWLVTSSSVSGHVVRLSVRKGDKVGSYLVHLDARLYHGSPDKPHSDPSWVYVTPKRR